MSKSSFSSVWECGEIGGGEYLNRLDKINQTKKASVLPMRVEWIEGPEQLDLPDAAEPDASNTTAHYSVTYNADRLFSMNGDITIRKILKNLHMQGTTVMIQDSRMTEENK